MGIWDIYGRMPKWWLPKSYSQPGFFAAAQLGANRAWTAAPKRSDSSGSFRFRPEFGAASKSV